MTSVSSGTSYNSPLTDAVRRAVVDELLRQSRTPVQADQEEIWDKLCAAHVVGQNDAALHIRVHWAMLIFAGRNRDGVEMVGQIFRLALVPLGHLFRRLPPGNTGRANVSAFQAMTVSPKIAELIKTARNSSQIGIYPNKNGHQQL